MASSDSGGPRNHLESSSAGSGECELPLCSPRRPWNGGQPCETTTHTHTQEELCGLRVHVMLICVNCSFGLNFWLKCTIKSCNKHQRWPKHTTAVMLSTMWSSAICHKHIQDDSTGLYESQANNRLTCETWAQILVLSLFFEFLGLVWISTSNLGAGMVGEFPGVNEMGVFPNKHNFKGWVLCSKVGLNANMYSFNFLSLPQSISVLGSNT